MKSVGLRLISGLFLSTLAFGFTACGDDDEGGDETSTTEDDDEPTEDDDEPTEDDDEPTEEGEPGADGGLSGPMESSKEISLDTGLGGERTLVSLEPAELQMVCDAIEKSVTGLVEGQCQLAGAFGALLSAQTDAEFKEACEAGAAQCVEEAGGAAEGDCDTEPLPETCEATVADLESCTSEGLSAAVVLSSSVSCDQTLEAAQAALLGGGLPDLGGEEGAEEELQEEAEELSAACAAMETCEGEEEEPAAMEEAPAADEAQ